MSNIKQPTSTFEDQMLNWVKVIAFVTGGTIQNYLSEAVVFFLLGDSPAFEFYMLTFWNVTCCKDYLHLL